MTPFPSGGKRTVSHMRGLRYGRIKNFDYFLYLLFPKLMAVVCFFSSSLFSLLLFFVHASSFDADVMLGFSCSLMHLWFVAFFRLGIRVFLQDEAAERLVRRRARLDAWSVVPHKAEAESGAASQPVPPLSHWGA
jgi:hypothetical protein